MRWRIRMYSFSCIIIDTELVLFPISDHALNSLRCMTPELLANQTPSSRNYHNWYLICIITRLCVWFSFNLIGWIFVIVFVLSWLSTSYTFEKADDFQPCRWCVYLMLLFYALIWPFSDHFIRRSWREKDGFNDIILV